jgi:2-succinyl-5-enolpyruvyl-6-hydroxy-3-cyclohexene-1-carboxylate synthase
MLDFRTTNALWASVLVETLVRLGLRTAVISPGSRSTPLTLALAQHPEVDALPILDERSASFFALGRARRTGRAVVLVCTSGTAGAHYLPAVIEARESQVPLLLLTADRPPELRDCSSGQTIDQQKLFGTFPNAYGELALPEASEPLLRYLRQAIAAAWHQAHRPHPGPVHLNCPFRDPLAPVVSTMLDPAAVAIGPDFFSHLMPLDPRSPVPNPLPPPPLTATRGVIIAGPAQPLDPSAYCGAVAAIAQHLGWPILAEGLSPLRNHSDRVPGLITHYDAILRHRPHQQALQPQQVLQMGPLPTSKELRQWLAEVDPPRWIVDGGDRNRDPLHGQVRCWPGTVMDLAATLAASPRAHPPAPGALGALREPSDYWHQWQRLNRLAQTRLDGAMAAMTEIFEGKLAWLLPQVLPPETAVAIANSTPVRDVEWFWPCNDRHLRPQFSRGANGIDGTLSTALGMAHGSRHNVLITGDLAFLHDTNGLLIRPQLRGHLTVIVLNNQGGGIFEMLPVAQMAEAFEPFFATPQSVDLATLCAAYGVGYQPIHTWPQLVAQLQTWPESGLRLLELRSDRTGDTQRRRQWLADLARPEADAP